MTALLCTIFFLSGAAALLFETLWFHQAGLTFGNGVWATSLVLAGFMAGLALGNALVARLGARIQRPVRFYALMEAVIAVTGVALVYGLPLLTPILAPLLRPILEQAWVVNPIRLLIGFAVLLIPSTAMGATLPLLVKALLARDPNFGSVLGRLYGWNTLGAVVGAIAGEAALVEWFGIRGSALFAAGINLLVAVVAVSLSRSFESIAADPRPDHAAWRGTIPAAAKRRLLATFVAGGTLLALEVVWFRFLQLFIQASSLVFSLMLAVVLSGIALGSFAAGAVLRRHPEADRGAGLVALCAAILVPVLYRVFALVEFPDRYIVDWPYTLGYGALLMLPVALVSGALFTLLGAGLDRQLTPATRATGLLTFANTVGSGLGSLLGGFVLLPLLGMEASFLVLALSYLVAALLVLPRPESGLRPAFFATAALAIVAIVTHPFGLMQEHFLQIPLSRFGKGQELVAQREGRTETILYTRSSLLGEPMYYTLVTNGHGMSSTTPIARRYMKLYVWLPLVLNPEPKSALLISYGVGSTAKALTDTPSLERIDVVDLSREIIELSDVVFPDPAEHPLRDDRVNLHIEDGRYFLQTTEDRWDLITSEPPPPKNAGIVNLYTREYFELVFDRLTEGGMHTYWLPVHALTGADAKAIIRAYCDVFDDCTLWAASGLDWMLMGSRGASFAPSEENFRRLWRDPAIRAELAATGIDAPETIGATFMGDADDLAALTADALPLVDDFPKRLEDGMPPLRELWLEHAPWVDTDQNRVRFEESDWIAKAWPDSLRASTLPHFELQRIWVAQTNPVAARSLGDRVSDLDTVLRHGGVPSLALMELGSNADELAAIERLSGPDRRSPEVAYRKGLEAIVQGNWPEATAQLRRAHARMETNDALLRIRIYALCRAGRLEEATSLARRFAQRIPPSEGDQLYWSWMEENLGLPDPRAPRTNAAGRSGP